MNVTCYSCRSHQVIASFQRTTEWWESVLQCKAHLCTMSLKHMKNAFASRASYCIWTSAIPVVGLPVGCFPDCTPLLFCQVAAHVDMSGKVGWEGFDSEGRQAGPHSYLSSGLTTSNSCQPKFGHISGLLHHVLKAVQPNKMDVH